MSLKSVLPRRYRWFLIAGVTTIVFSSFIIWTSQNRTLVFRRRLNQCPIAYLHDHNKPAYRRTWDISPGREFTGSFQPVDLTNQTYVFSAYIDVLYRGSPGLIRIVALRLTNPTCRQPLFCIMRNSQKTWLVKAEFNQIPEHHNYRYSAAFIICPLNSSTVPSSVSVVSSGDQILLNKLTVPPLHHGLGVNFTVCVAPIHGNYDDLPQLIEFLEVNEILGANKFIFYNHSVSSRVSDILNRYIDRGLVDVIGWNLPFGAYTVQKGYFNVHYFGQLAAANDCLYRNRHKTQYIVSVDLDEFLVPRLNRSWVNLKTYLLRLHPSAGAFVFRSYIFNTLLSNHSSFYPQKAMAEKYKSVTLLKTNRTFSAFPVLIRPKTSYDPKRVSCVGIHKVWALLKGFVSYNIKPDVGAINHYRNGMVGNLKGNVLDNHMHSYQDEIADRLKARWTEILNKKSM